MLCFFFPFQNKQFIYRGLEYERIIAFTQRLQTEFSQAQILTKNTPPDQSIFTESGQFIQISNVRPIPDQPLSSMVPVPEKIARFYHVNDVTRFQHDRPVYKGQIDKDNEFKSLWIERTILDTGAPLPGILRWFEVINRSVQELKPVEFACETMENVQKELYDLIMQYRADPGRNINPFSMRLQGIIDANVMGGISKYQEAFFSEQFAKSPEGREQQANVQLLKSLILKQIQILDKALELHGNLAPEGVQPLHNRLLERYSQLKHSTAGMDKLRRQFSESIVNTPLPPLPVEKRAASLGATNTIFTNGTRAYQYSNYEQDEIYTRPMESTNVNAHHQRCYSNHEQNLSITDSACCDSSAPAPPVPHRPKSTTFSMGASDSPEVPPKLSIKDCRQPLSLNTLTPIPAVPPPPLPPRGCTPDKRASNPINFSLSNSYTEVQFGIETPIVPKRNHPKYQVINISLEDQTEVDNHLGQSNTAFTFNSIEQPPPIDFRDSGISTASELNNPSGYGDYVVGDVNAANNSSGADCLNIQSLKEQVDDHDLENDNPPPIPKKSCTSCIDNEAFHEQLNKITQNDDLNENENNDDNADIEIPADGYCVPKITKKE